MRAKLTAEQLRQRRLATYNKYNTSLKGKARYERYEAKHPERSEARWEPARNELGRD
jgi:hypothetical protein